MATADTASTTSTRSGKRTRPWSDAEVRGANWRRGERPVKSYACAARYQVAVGNRFPQRYERRGPDHGKCEGTSFGLCACNCHYEWRMVAPEVVRLRDGRVGVVDVVYKAPEWAMRVLTGGGISAVVDIGEPVLLDPGELQSPDELAAFTRS